MRKCFEIVIRVIYRSQHLRSELGRLEFLGEAIQRTSSSHSRHSTSLHIPAVTLA